MISTMLEVLILFINIIFIGHLPGSAKLAGAGLAYTIINCFFVSLFAGLNGVVETLVA